MPFNVSIVLTGATLVNNNIDVYSNPVSNINHGTFVTSVTKTCLTTNSPCTVTVPDGTVTIRLRDSGSYCFWDLPTCSSNVCQDCGLGFSYVNNNQNGTVDIGNLTGSCDNSIDDFRIEWLGPNSLSTTGFTSGKGTQYSYSNTHPLTGSNAPLLLPGNYVSRITNVNLNNVKFSSIDGLPGHVYSPTLSACSTTVTVVGLNCSNGNVPDDQYYKHQKLYITTNPLATPAALNTSFQLNNGQKFFVFEFTGYQVWDRLKLTLTGSSYPYPIVLEDYKIGTNSGGNNYNPTSFPKSTTRETVRKIITLTGLTITNNDYIYINLTPNTDTNNTSWQFKFGCRDTISYEKNCLNTYKNKPYKIKLSTLSATTLDDCGRFYINCDISGCTSSQNSGWVNSDFRYLIGSSVSESNLSTNNSTGLYNHLFGQFYPSYNQYSDQWVYYPTYTCSSTTGLYTYQKVTGTTAGSNKIIFKFQNSSDSTAFQTQFTNAKTPLTWNSNNTTSDYYQYIRLYFVYSTSVSQVCVDGGTFYVTSVDIAPNAVMSSSTVAGAYPNQVEITTPTMTYNSTIFTGTCIYNMWPNKIDTINNFATGFTYYLNATPTTVTSKNIPLMSWGSIKYNFNTSGDNTSDTKNAYLSIFPKYDFYTYPANGNTDPPTLLPAFSGSPFPEQRYIDEFSGPPNNNNYRQDLWYYSVQITSITPPIKFRIYGYDISNYTTTNYHLIYDNNLPSPVVDSNFFF